MNYLEISYRILKSVYSGGAYAHIALAEAGEQVTPVVTKIVYGTIENWLLLEYNLSMFFSKKPQNSVLILLLMATYCLKFLSIPEHAIVNESVELAVKIGKKETKGFINKILRMVAKQDLKRPEKDSFLYEEVKYNLPSWIINKVKNDYPKDYDKILTNKNFELEHVRLNSIKKSNKDFEKNIDVAKRTNEGYLVKKTEDITNLFNKGELTFQSIGSIKVVNALGNNIKDKKILDVCAAPGGKSVYMAEKGAIVTACDIHQHRLDLIRSYAKRMDVSLEICCMDATITNPKYINVYDIVLADVPCSGLGVIGRRQDIIFNKKAGDINNINKVQRKILQTVKDYVKVNGILLYSTCTILKSENKDIISWFLKNNKNYVLDENQELIPKSGEEQLLPIKEGMEGYYIARMRRIS